MRIILALAMIMQLALTAKAVDRPVSGSLESIVSEMLRADVTSEAQHLLYSFRSNGSTYAITVTVFNSSFAHFDGLQKDNCVAPLDRAELNAISLFLIIL